MPKRRPLAGAVFVFAPDLLEALLALAAHKVEPVADGVAEVELLVARLGRVEGFGRKKVDRESAFPQLALELPQHLARLLPLALILLWTAIVRLPFYGTSNGDEYFFSIVAGEWLRGGLPYVDAFDIKPPGLFFIYAVVQGVFGASAATFKGMEIVAVALGGWAMFAMLRRHASARLATAPSSTIPW